jgi:hypothetical protein
MIGDSMRCKRCNQYAPDRCLCGLSITDPPTLENMALARHAFENEIRNEFGAHALIGSPTYSVRAVDRKWFTFWQCWQTATRQHLVTIASLRQQVSHIETCSRLQERQFVASVVFPGAWHEVSQDVFATMTAAGHATRTLYEKPAPIPSGTAPE